MKNIVQTYFNILYKKYDKLSITAPVGMGTNYRLLKSIANDIENNNKNLLVVSYNKTLSEQFQSDLLLYLNIKIEKYDSYAYYNSNLIEFKTITDIMKDRYSKRHNDILYIDDSLNNNDRLSDKLLFLINKFDKVIIRNTISIKNTKFSKLKDFYYENITYNDNVFMNKIKSLERRIKINKIVHELL